MPLFRAEIPAEERLADPALYKAAPKDDPSAVLQGVAMASLVGILRQLGELSEYAAGVFDDVWREVEETTKRREVLLSRVKNLEKRVPQMEEMLLKESDPLRFVHNPGLRFRADVNLKQQHFTYSRPPSFVLQAYKQCHPPPQFHRLDRFREVAVGSCMKRYSDPTFFKRMWENQELLKAYKKRRRVGDSGSATSRSSKSEETALHAVADSNLEGAEAGFEGGTRPSFTPTKGEVRRLSEASSSQTTQGNAASVGISHHDNPTRKSLLKQFTSDSVSTQRPADEGYLSISHFKETPKQKLQSVQLQVGDGEEVEVGINEELKSAPTSDNARNNNVGWGMKFMNSERGYRPESGSLEQVVEVEEEVSQREEGLRPLEQSGSAYSEAQGKRQEPPADGLQANVSSQTSSSAKENVSAQRESAGSMKSGKVHPSGTLELEGNEPTEVGGSSNSIGSGIIPRYVFHLDSGLKFGEGQVRKSGEVHAISMGEGEAADKGTDPQKESASILDGMVDASEEDVGGRGGPGELNKTQQVEGLDEDWKREVGKKGQSDGEKRGASWGVRNLIAPKEGKARDDLKQLGSNSGEVVEFERKVSEDSGKTKPKEEVKKGDGVWGGGVGKWLSRTSSIKNVFVKGPGGTSETSPVKLVESKLSLPSLHNESATSLRVEETFEAALTALHQERFSPPWEELQTIESLEQPTGLRRAESLPTLKSTAVASSSPNSGVPDDEVVQDAMPMLYIQRPLKMTSTLAVEDSIQGSLQGDDGLSQEAVKAFRPDGRDLSDQLPPFPLPTVVEEGEPKPLMERTVQRLEDGSYHSSADSTHAASSYFPAPSITIETVNDVDMPPFKAAVRPGDQSDSRGPSATASPLVAVGTLNFSDFLFQQERAETTGETRHLSAESALRDVSSSSSLISSPTPSLAAATAAAVDFPLPQQNTSFPLGPPLMEDLGSATFSPSAERVFPSLPSTGSDSLPSIQKDEIMTAILEHLEQKASPSMASVPSDAASSAGFEPGSQSPLSPVSVQIGSPNLGPRVWPLLTISIPVSASEGVQENEAERMHGDARTLTGALSVKVGKEAEGKFSPSERQPGEPGILQRSLSAPVGRVETLENNDSDESQDSEQDELRSALNSPLSTTAEATGFRSGPLSPMIVDKSSPYHRFSPSPSYKVLESPDMMIGWSSHRRFGRNWAERKGENEAGTGGVEHEEQEKTGGNRIVGQSGATTEVGGWKAVVLRSGSPVQRFPRVGSPGWSSGVGDSSRTASIASRRPIMLGVAPALSKWTELEESEGIRSPGEGKQWRENAKLGLSADEWNGGGAEQTHGKADATSHMVSGKEYKSFRQGTARGEIDQKSGQILEGAADATVPVPPSGFSSVGQTSAAYVGRRLSVPPPLKVPSSTTGDVGERTGVGQQNEDLAFREGPAAPVAGSVSFYPRKSDGKGGAGQHHRDIRAPSALSPSIAPSSPEKGISEEKVTAGVQHNAMPVFTRKRLEEPEGAVSKKQGETGETDRDKLPEDVAHSGAGKQVHAALPFTSRAEENSFLLATQSSTPAPPSPGEHEDPPNSVVRARPASSQAAVGSNSKLHVRVPLEKDGAETRPSNRAGDSAASENNLTLSPAHNPGLHSPNQQLSSPQPDSARFRSVFLASFRPAASAPSSAASTPTGEAPKKGADGPSLRKGDAMFYSMSFGSLNTLTTLPDTPNPAQRTSARLPALTSLSPTSSIRSSVSTPASRVGSPPRAPRRSSIPSLPLAPQQPPDFTDARNYDRSIQRSQSQRYSSKGGNKSENSVESGTPRRSTAEMRSPAAMRRPVRDFFDDAERKMLRELEAKARKEELEAHRKTRGLAQALGNAQEVLSLPPSQSFSSVEVGRGLVDEETWGSFSISAVQKSKTELPLEGRPQQNGHAYPPVSSGHLNGTQLLHAKAVAENSSANSLFDTSGNQSKEAPDAVPFQGFGHDCSGLTKCQHPRHKAGLQDPIEDTSILSQQVNGEGGFPSVQKLQILDESQALMKTSITDNGPLVSSQGSGNKLPAGLYVSSQRSSEAAHNSRMTRSSATEAHPPTRRPSLHPLFQPIVKGGPAEEARKGVQK